MYFMTFGQNGPKLNSRPVYCSRLYGIPGAISALEPSNGKKLDFSGVFIFKPFNPSKRDFGRFWPLTASITSEAKK